MSLFNHRNEYDKKSILHRYGNLEFHFEADSELDGEVSAWKDLSRHKRHATPSNIGNKPVCHSNVINGKKGIYFQKGAIGGPNNSLLILDSFRIQSLYVVANYNISSTFANWDGIVSADCEPKWNRSLLIAGTGFPENTSTLFQYGHGMMETGPGAQNGICYINGVNTANFAPLSTIKPVFTYINFRRDRLYPKWYIGSDRDINEMAYGNRGWGGYICFLAGFSDLPVGYPTNSGVDDYIREKFGFTYS